MNQGKDDERLPGVDVLDEEEEEEEEEDEEDDGGRLAVGTMVAGAADAMKQGALSS